MDKLPEDLFRKWWLNNSEAGLTHSGIGFHAFTSGFNAGRKAERERCLAIIERWRPMPSEIWIAVSDEIAKGGQDGK